MAARLIQTRDETDDTLTRLNTTERKADSRIKSRAGVVDCWERTKAAVEQSRKQLNESAGIIQWCESFGPRPASDSRTGVKNS